MVEKTRLHPRNRNRDRYDLAALINSTQALNKFVVLNKYGVESVDFSNPLAVKLLNQALLSHYYGIKNWDFPDENLCPPIPGRADYIHYIADLLSENNFGEIPLGEKITGLDIGTGASLIYPIIGSVEYDWSFVASDINPESLAFAEKIINSNDNLKDKIELRIQQNSKSIFAGIIAIDEKFDFTMCNPPFHTSQEEAQKGTLRKIKNLSGKSPKTAELNFAGINNELIFEGGEFRFIQIMIQESKLFSKNCLWFSTLVSKQSNLKGIYKLLEHFEAVKIKTIPMGTGNKSTRIVAWTYLSKEEQKKWRENKWK